MAATREVAGRRVARATRPGRARTTCEGGRVAIVDGGSGTAPRPHGAVFDLSGPDLRIVVVDAAHRPLVEFGPFAEEDVIATWRSLSRTAGLVPMMRAHDETEELGRSLGRLRIGSSTHRRRLPVSGRRRPRFLARRKSACLSARPLVYRESEIAGGRGR